MSQAHQHLRGIWTMNLAICLNFLSSQSGQVVELDDHCRSLLTENILLCVERKDYLYRSQIKYFSYKLGLNARLSKSPKDF